MFLLFLLLIGFFLYQTGDLQKMLGKVKRFETPDYDQEARRVLDLRYASGELSAEEYIKTKNLL